MTNSKDPNEQLNTQQTPSKKETRQQREGRALRENLKRRKEQLKARENALKNP